MLRYLWLFLLLHFSFSYGLSYIVKKKDTVMGICIKNKIRCDDFKNINSLENDNIKLDVGKVLKIPPYEYYKKKSRQTWEIILNKLSISMDEVKLLNSHLKIENENIIRIRKIKDFIKKKRETQKQKTLKLNKNKIQALDKVIDDLDDGDNIELFEMIQKKDFVWPTNGKIEDLYGLYTGNIMNYGIDISSVTQKIYASEEGKVIYVGNIRGVGKAILISHDNGLYSFYSGDLNVKVKMNRKVKRKQVIAVTKSDLFFAVYKSGYPINPLNILL